MYAILDIETTGGKYNEEGITEIAIYQFDGHEITDQFISLVNPERPIQPFVVNLTGINNDMLRNAPRFFEIAKRIVEITTDCIIVAHNAAFDYRILRTEFKRLGFDFERKSICTVALAEKLLPEQKSYSLGKLVRNLGIPIADRHRANGDAMATVKLFKLLLSKDIDKKIITKTVNLNVKKVMDRKLIDLIETLPAKTGVYYIHNENGRIIFIGKSRNIQKKITAHFTNDNKKSKMLQEQVHSVTFEITGSELLAILKEAEEIRRIKPTYNTTASKRLFTAALYVYQDENGFMNLKFGRYHKNKEAITTFSNTHQASSFYEKWTEQYQLKPSLTHFFSKTSSHQNKKQILYENNQESTLHYNKRVTQLIADQSFSDQDCVLIDSGRRIEEKSFTLIIDGKIQGIGFYDLNHQIHQKDILKSLSIPIQHSANIQHLVHSYMRRKRLKILPLQDKP